MINLVKRVSGALARIFSPNASLKPIFSVTPKGTPFLFFNILRDLSIQTVASIAQLVCFPII